MISKQTECVNKATGDQGQNEMALTVFLWKAQYRSRTNVQKAHVQFKGNIVRETGVLIASGKRATQGWEKPH